MREGFDYQSELNRMFKATGVAGTTGCNGRCINCPLGYTQFSEGGNRCEVQYADECKDIVYKWSVHNPARVVLFDRVPRDTAVLVRDTFDQDWVEVYFAWYTEGAEFPFVAFAGGEKSCDSFEDDLCSWRYCKLADEDNADESWYKQESE